MDKNNKQLVDFLSSLFHRAVKEQHLEESIMVPVEVQKAPESVQAIEQAFLDKNIQRPVIADDEKRPFVPQAFAILTDTGHLFGAVVGNPKTDNNPNGENPLQAAFDNLNAHRFLLPTEFRISAVGVTFTSEGETLNLMHYPQEKGLLLDAGVQSVFQYCPLTGSHQVLEI